MRNMKLIGPAKAIHCKKVGDFFPGNKISYCCAKIKFGGVPIGVAIPPMLELKAIPRYNPNSMPRKDFAGVSFEYWLFRRETIAAIFGIKIKHVAVFESHILIA